MPALKHIHTYRRDVKNKNLYRCLHPDCTTKMLRDDIVGKRAMCKCDNEFILTFEKLHRNIAVPKCDSCSNSKQAKKRVAAQQEIEKMLAQRLAMPVFDEPNDFQKQLADSIPESEDDGLFVDKRNRTIDLVIKEGKED